MRALYELHFCREFNICIVDIASGIICPKTEGQIQTIAITSFNTANISLIITYDQYLPIFSNISHILTTNNSLKITSFITTNILYNYYTVF